MNTAASNLRQHSFPMVRSGGLFVLLVGIGIVVGAILGENHLLVPLVVGACVALVVQSIFRNRLVKPLGKPTRFQIAALVGAIILEIILTGIVAYSFDFQQSRRFWLWILLVVGSHFFVIAVAQGKLLLLLGVLCIANAAVGFLLPDAPLLIFWLVDGILKIIVGTLMLLTKPMMQTLVEDY